MVGFARTGELSVTPVVTAVSRKSRHGIGKSNQLSIRLVTGIGVEGDAHAGAEVQHLSRRMQQPLPPNLRQVHLIHEELHQELGARGFVVAAGEMGENITTRGLDLLSLPAHARLRLGRDAIVEITGLRNPCVQLEQLQAGLMMAVLGRDEGGSLVRKAGVMAIVVQGGDVTAGDLIAVELPPAPHQPLNPV